MIPKFSKSAYLFIIFIIIIPLTISRLVIDPALLPKQLLFSLFTLVLSFFVLFDKKGTKNIISGSVNFIFFLIAIFILLTSFSISNAINRGEAIAEWLKISNQLIYIPIGYFALKKTNQNELIKFLSIAVSVVAVIVVVSGFFRLAGLLISEDYSHQLTYKISVSFGHRNLYSQFLLLCMPFLMMGIIKFKDRIRLYFIILSFLVILLIVLLLTKSVWISFTGAVVQTILLGFFLIRYKKFKKYIIPVSVFFAAIIISTIIIIKLTSVETFVKQTDFIGNYKHGSSLERINLWKKSLQIFKEKPVLGVGQAGWKIYIPKYGTKEMHSGEGNIHFQRPHNDFIWILTENGIFALILYLIIIFTFYFYTFSNFFRAKSFNDKTLSITLLFGLTSFLLISFFSFPRERTEHTFYFHTLLILILLTQFKENKAERKVSYISLKRVVAMVALIISAAALIITTIRIKSEIHTLKALKFKSKSSWKGVIKEIREADNYFYKTDPTATPLSWYSGSAYFNLGDKNNAQKEFIKAYNIHPNHVHVLNNLATSYELDELHSVAIALYDRTIKISPGFIDPYLNLCTVYFNTGKIDMALDVLKRVDPENDSEKLRDYIIVVMKEKIRILSHKIDEKILLEKLKGVGDNDDWIVIVFQHSIINNSDIDSQLMEEVIYSLEEIDKAISHDEAEKFRKKYVELK